MNLADNKFILSRIKQSANGITLFIDIESDEETKNVYCNNYFEGLFIGNTQNKYNVYSEVINGQIVGEILYDTIEAMSSDKTENLQRLWVRCRIGDTYIDFAVYLAIDKKSLYFGHKNQILFTSKDGFCFYFLRISSPFNLYNSLENICVHKTQRDLNDFRIHIDGDILTFKVNVSARLLCTFSEEGIISELILAWKDIKSKKVYFFHSEKIVDGCVNYQLTKEEIEQFSILESDLNIFDWVMFDSVGREYKIYVDANEVFEKKILPVNDFCAQLMIAEDEHVFVIMDSAIYFEYIDHCYEGKGFVLNYKKRSYNLEVVEVIAQRVNTNIEYKLPFEILNENEESISYGVKLDFEVDEIDFKIGIHQIWVKIKDGIVLERIPLKLYRNMPIKENSYLIAMHPYTVIGQNCYNCLFYNDNSYNLKINIIPKLMKIQIGKIVLNNNILCIPLIIELEPYFNSISSVCLLAENKDKIEVGYEVFKSEKKNRIKIGLNILVDAISEYGLSAFFIPQIRFEGCESYINIENNFFRPPVSNREVSGFSFYKDISSKLKRRIWGDYQNGNFYVGITENANLIKEMGVWLYGEDKLCIRLDWILSDDEYDSTDIELYLRDKFTGEELTFDRELAVEDEIIFKISLEFLRCSEFLLVAKLPRDTLSYLEMTSASTILFSNKISKKIMLKKNVDRSLSISVDNMLLFENTEKIEECRIIIDRAHVENIGINRKVWLVGENYGLSARDNGLAFFEYCMEKQENIDAEVYFVSKTENKDFSVLNKYKSNVILYDSEEHIYMDEIAEFYIVSHGIRDVMPSLYHDNIGNYRKNVIYLQHGIAAMKKFSISNKSYGESIRRFVVSSKQEKDFMILNRQFWDDEIIVTGLARYDKLEKSGECKEGYIWCMPTWRDWLIKSEKDFEYSDFYGFYGRFLSDSSLIKLLRKCKKQIVFSLHVEFEKYKGYFKKFENDVIHITDIHEKSISDRVKECSMIITDYSSVIFDVVYLKKPVVFFQFDQQIYNKYRGSYVDLEADLPGEVTYTPIELICAVKEMIHSNFVVEDKYIEKALRYFDYMDCNNSQRIYDEIIKLREEIADEYKY